MNELKLIERRVRNRLIYWRRIEHYRKSNLAYQKEHRDDIYKRNREWIKARVRLRNLCRPDLYEVNRQCQRLGGFPEARPFDPKLAASLERVYSEKLRELRIIFGRDPDTGRPLPADRHQGKDSLHAAAS